jgi:hypothetical protein
VLHRREFGTVPGHPTQQIAVVLALRIILETVVAAIGKIAVEHGKTTCIVNVQSMNELPETTPGNASGRHNASDCQSKIE